MGDYGDVGKAVEVFVRIMVPLAIIGTVAVLVALGFGIYWLCGHMRFV